MHKLKLIFYYAFLSHLPSSRFSSLFSNWRAWYFCHILKIMNSGEHPSMVGPNVYIRDGHHIKLGSGCRINENVYLEKVSIGDNVMIAPHVAILSRMHQSASVDIPMSLQGYKEEQQVIIGDDVWIGRNVVIMPGIMIAKGSIVGAGAVVTKNVAEYSIVAGVPAKFIKSRLETSLEN